MVNDRRVQDDVIDRLLLRHELWDLQRRCELWVFDRAVTTRVEVHDRIEVGHFVGEGFDLVELEIVRGELNRVSLLLRRVGEPGVGVAGDGPGIEGAMHLIAGAFKGEFQIAELLTVAGGVEQSEIALSNRIQLCAMCLEVC